MHGADLGQMVQAHRWVPGCSSRVHAGAQEDGGVKKKIVVAGDSAVDGPETGDEVHGGLQAGRGTRNLIEASLQLHHSLAALS